MKKFKELFLVVYSLGFVLCLFATMTLLYDASQESEITVKAVASAQLPATYVENEIEDLAEEDTGFEIVETDDPLNYIIEENNYIIEVTDDEIELLARVVMSESSVLGMDVKIGVACTVINRVRSDYREFANLNSVTDVINYPNAFSTSNNGEPTEECYIAVEHALTNDGCYPPDMYWFCYGFQPKYGYFYANPENNYFTTLTNYYEE